MTYGELERSRAEWTERALHAQQQLTRQIELADELAVALDGVLDADPDELTENGGQRWIDAHSALAKHSAQQWRP
jgi:hypothetical protein